MPIKRKLKGAICHLGGFDGIDFVFFANKPLACLVKFLPKLG